MTKAFVHIRLFGSVFLVGVSALFIAGCQPPAGTMSPLPLSAFDYRQRHPIVIAEASENLDLPIGASTRSLSQQMKGSLIAFAQQARLEGNGYVEVLIPRGSANQRAVQAVKPSIRSSLKEGGIAPTNIVMRGYPVHDPEASGPIRVSFARVKATVAECGQWPENLVGQANNKDYQNFGCATQANLAAMVDNPADLLYPRAATPPDATRRGVVIEKYRQGQSTASTFTEGVGAKVSDSN
ncbi:CpaD family pilus assembly protein [Flexibacterium corallicola]|uniref:CpaD family pilus assembly protein n=1 Tax=Flexibacterium corallicola TaxID=3037259 RepID=UPI00286F3885|nr:CpaD family pilus assembly protein [Pseudovibrio sp. M1P-2-3]